MLVHRTSALSNHSSMEQGAGVELGAADAPRQAIRAVPLGVRGVEGRLQALLRAVLLGRPFDQGRRTSPPIRAHDIESRNVEVSDLRRIRSGPGAPPDAPSVGCPLHVVDIADERVSACPVRWDEA